MRWYAKDEGTGTIYGPMDKDKALAFIDAFEGTVFSDEVFAPSFVLTSKSKELVIEMRDELQKDVHLTGRGRIKELFQRSIDTITLLSREKTVTGSVEGGVLSLGDVPEGVAVDIRDYDVVEGVDGDLEEDEQGDVYLQIGTV